MILLQNSLIVFALSCALLLPAEAQWTNDRSVNTPVCLAPGTQSGVKIASDGSGGAILAWNDARADSSNVYVQRLDKNGLPKWTVNGIPIYPQVPQQTLVDIFSDGTGGAILGWVDNRDATPTVYLQRVDGAGVSQWGAGGIPAAEASAVVLASNTTGDILMSWSSGGDIYVQKVSSSGSLQWGSGGVVVCNDTNSQTSPVIGSDGASGAIVAWRDLRVSRASIFSQRIDSDGNVQWGLNGNLVDSTLPPPIPGQAWVIGLLCGIATDINGATILYEKVNLFGTDNNAFPYTVLCCSKLTPSGTLQWGSLQVESRSTIANERITSDLSGGSVVTFDEAEMMVPTRVRAKRINANGVILWSTMSLPFSSTTSHAVDDKAGGFTFLYASNYPGPTFLNIYSIHINAVGVKDPPVDPAVSVAPGDKVRPVALSNGFGGIVAAWSDDRISGDRNIYAQNDPTLKLILKDNGGSTESLEWGTFVGGTDGIDAQYGEFELPPAPPIGVFDVRWKISGTEGTKRDIRDTLGGSRQQIVYKGAMQPGVAGYPFTIKWNRAELPSGILILQDSPNGTRFSADMRQQDSLVVTDPDIGLFQIIYDRRPTQKLFVRDAAGFLDSLEYGTGVGGTDGIDISLGEFELPPLPPIGVFDIRWKIAGTLGTKIDVRDTLGGAHTRETYVGLVQPAGGHPLTLHWNKSALPAGSFTLRDAPSGTRLSVDMKKKDSLVITDPDITSFQITHDLRPIHRLFTHDNGGFLDSLEYGTMAGATDGIDAQLGEYELPPPPPIGVFDVRWQIPGTQGSKLDTRDTLGGTRIKTVYKGLMQPGAGGYPFVLKWKRAELPVGSLVLRDGPGGTRFVVDMNVQDSVVISDPDISSFLLIHDLRPTLHSTVQSGWNLLSLPLTVDDGRKSWLYPGSTSSAFVYTPSGYSMRDTLENGLGYWLKFSSAEDVGITGTPRLLDTVTVVAGWNLIGTISDSISVTTIQQNPPTIVASQFFGYSGGYSGATVLTPSKGYWVKAIAPGILILSSSSSFDNGAVPSSSLIETAAKVTLSDAQLSRQTLSFAVGEMEAGVLDYYELPPSAPFGLFDARFSTNRMLENVKEGEERIIPIQVSHAVYPLTISWDMKEQPLTASIVVGSGEVPMSGIGSTIISDPNASLSLRLGGRAGIPKEFALSQNYPNPFNPSTTIKYDLPNDTRVNLSLYNILGQQVLTLVNEEQKAGYKSMEWQASSFASGVYFYRLHAGDFVQTRKLLLLK